MCDKGVYNRITIENEDKGFFNVDNCIKFSDYLFNTFGANIPICYDNLHDFCNPSEGDPSVAFNAERCAYTWINQGGSENNFIAPVFHWSEGKPEKPRAHADYFALGNTPPHIAIDVDKPAKWECEVKGKDKAIRLLQKSLT
jgi:UV DNA damage repair endonuclease